LTPAAWEAVAAHRAVHSVREELSHFCTTAAITRCRKVEHQQTSFDSRLTFYWRKTQMNATKLIGIVLIAAGCLGLAYGGFSYTKETTGVKLGPLELKVQEKERVNVPLIVSAGAIVLGVFLLVVGRK
jgi:uncharacterized membrane protein YidH (DUF202 family)